MTSRAAPTVKEPASNLERAGRGVVERAFVLGGLGAVVLPLLLLAVWVGLALVEGAARMSWDPLTAFPSRRAESAGLLPALVGSVLLMGLTALLALPVGVGAAIYLEEYGQRSKLAAWIEINIANLAAVPSVVYGLLGLGLFVRALGLGRSLLAGAATLSLLVLPMVILSSREALRRVPRALREACDALGATRWQALRRVVLPAALPGILSRALLCLSRALGEAAPLIVVGGLAVVPFSPDGAGAPFTALPLQIVDWLLRPQREFWGNAAAGVLVLLVTTLSLQALAVLLRARSSGRSA